MKKRIWEYMVIVDGSAHITGNLNGLGNMGWELVSATYDHTRGGYTLFLKREIAR